MERIEVAPDEVVTENPEFTHVIFAGAAGETDIEDGDLVVFYRGKGSCAGRDAPFPIPDVIFFSHEKAGHRLQQHGHNS